jgi:hypothetical protein
MGHNQSLASSIAARANSHNHRLCGPTTRTLLSARTHLRRQIRFPACFTSVLQARFSAIGPKLARRRTEGSSRDAQGGNTRCSTRCTLRPMTERIWSSLKPARSNASVSAGSSAESIGVRTKPSKSDPSATCWAPMRSTA